MFIIFIIVVAFAVCHLVKRTDKQLLDAINVSVAGITITWASSSLCTWLGRFGSKISRVLELWFGIGALLCSFIAAMNLLVLAVNFVRLLFVVLFLLVSAVDGHHVAEVGSEVAVPNITSSEPRGKPSTMLLQLLIPGVTVPASHASHLFMAAFVTLSFHELGHALAAAATHLHITNFGFSLYAIFPTTFVVIEDHIRRISPHRQLRIYTAGAFHNLVQAVVVFLLLPVVPLLLRPMWMTCSISNTNNCVWVTQVQNTVLEDIIQLPRPVGAIGIKYINGMSVGGVGEWMSILDGLGQTEVQHFCVKESMIASAGSDKSCCSKGYNGTLLCYEDRSNLTSGGVVCISGKEVADQPWRVDCCSYPVSGLSCLSLTEAIVGDPDTFVFRLEFTTGQKLTFIDTIQSISQVGLRQYHPTYIPVTAEYLYDDDHSLYWDVFPYSVVPDFPEDLTVLLGYIQMISLGLMLVNLVPFPGLDGQFVFSCLLQILSERLCSPPAPAPELVEIVVNSNTRKQQQQQQQQQLLINSSDLSSVRLVGQYGDTGLVDHQLQQQKWRRWLLLFGSILLVGNWGLSLIVSLLR
eukprot:TRINITY_DN1419_c0_g2_i1.p1 TRINITY_DN1419_c0_g2~~TRINITY_DN1419_c0_g2_i1.p1  ORF type:complete len:579 (+),score=96.19 TRINITY_DN1419_c0_g2_i1:129-1865(+)